MLSSRKGHSLLFLAFTAPPLIIFWSLLFDESSLINQEISSQTISDAAALSASSYYDDHYYDECPAGTNKLQAEAKERADTILQAARTNSDVHLSTITTAKTESHLRVRVLAKAHSVGLLSRFLENTAISDAIAGKLYDLSNDDLNLLTDAPQTRCYTPSTTCPPGEHPQCVEQGNCPCTNNCRGGGTCNTTTGLCEGGHDDGLECAVPVGDPCPSGSHQHCFGNSCFCHFECYFGTCVSGACQSWWVLENGNACGGGLICKNPGTCVNGKCDKGKDKGKACFGPS